MAGLVAAFKVLSMAGKGPDEGSTELSSSSKPARDYFATNPSEIGENIAKFLDKDSLIAFSSCSRICCSISAGCLWSKVILEFPIVESEKSKVEFLFRNAHFVRTIYVAFDIGLLVGQIQVAFTGMTIPSFLERFPGLKEFRLVEITPQPWEVRANIVAHILNRQHRLEILSLWLSGVTPCPIDIIYRVFQQQGLHIVKPSRLKILEIFLHFRPHLPNERGEYLFKPFLNLFGARLGSLEDFCLNLEGAPVARTIARRHELEGLSPEQVALALNPFSMPSLTFFDLDSICYFEHLSQFVTLDSLANVRCLAMYTGISVPDHTANVVIMGPPEKTVEDLVATLRHFKGLKYLMINIGEPFNNNGNALATLPPAFWDAWASEVSKFCWVVPTLSGIRGQAGLTGQNFRVARNEDGAHVEKVMDVAEREAIWDEIKALNPNSHWDYWKGNLWVED
ncbi:hypothetical protein TWF506_011106 [Arthrobotrys conoides]|uniref:F-box domain-containing protein n=1 Tax=Arthrobotrys conoides TaxID=74498 RepID=A0AAN8N0L1_9PEZI